MSGASPRIIRSRSTFNLTPANHADGGWTAGALIPTPVYPWIVRGLTASEAGGNGSAPATPKARLSIGVDVAVGAATDAADAAGAAGWKIEAPGRRGRPSEKGGRRSLS